MERICSTCAMYIATQMRCARTNAPEMPTNSCGHWAKEAPKCALCGNLFLPPATYLEIEDAYAAICPSCLGHLGKCGTCKASSYCDFQENPIPIPPMIQATRRQGNTIITQTIPNMQRVLATCVASGCKCWHQDDEAKEKWCCRQFGCCGNYDMKDMEIERNEDGHTKIDTVPTDNGDGTETANV